MEPTNRRRVLRALEVTVGSGRPFSSFGPGVDAHPTTPFTLVGLAVDRDALASKIAERHAAQSSAGFLNSVIALRAPPQKDRAAGRGIGWTSVSKSGVTGS